jgi:hypothetical protein
MNQLVPGLIEARGSALALTGTTSLDSREQESFATRLLRDRVSVDRVSVDRVSVDRADGDRAGGDRADGDRADGDWADGDWADGDWADGDWVSAGLPSLWPTALLPGWYDDWVVFERERLHQLRLHALERTAELMLQRGNLDLALQVALEAVRGEPLRETSNAALISVYLAEGNISDALQQYDVFTALLDRELGLPPSQRITGLLPATRRHRDAVVTSAGS